MKRRGKLYRQITEWDNLLIAFYNAAHGKRLKPDVALYEKNLYENLKILQTHLINQTVPLGNYRLGGRVLPLHNRMPTAYQIS